MSEGGRIRAEERLWESGRRFRSLVEYAAVAVCLIDLRGRFTYVNKAMGDLLGYSPQELIGRSFKEFLHPDDRGRVIRLFLRIIVLRRQPRNLEFRVIRKDGQVLHLMSKPTRFKINSKTVGFQAIIVDITEHKKAEAALRESQAKLRSISTHLQMPLYSLF